MFQSFCDLLIAGMLIQPLGFKFAIHPDSIYIFTIDGLEPITRIGISITELVADILLLFDKKAWAGTMLAIGIVGGAIMMHL